jgi:hypothetical protein
VLKVTGYRADEIYVETMKDQVSAQNLLEEIETAMLHHPTPRQSMSFVSRADALVKRLALRSNPASPSTIFPCPDHLLFPDQKPLNDALVGSLSSEILSVSELAAKVDCTAKEYRTAYAAVKQVEILFAEAKVLSQTFTSVLDRLHNGVSAGDGDGSPPSLMSEACLDQSLHSAFLALLPSICEESEKASEEAEHVLRRSELGAFALDFPGIDSAFKADTVSTIQRLASLHDQARSACSDVKSRVSRLREARRIWGAMCGALNDLEDVRRQLGDDMEKQRWRRLADQREKPLTPESPPPSPLPVDVPHMEASHVLDDLSAKLAAEVNAPLSQLSKTLETPLQEWLSQTAIGLTGLWKTVAKQIQLLESIRGQAAAMKNIHDEFNDLQIRIEDIKMRTQSFIDEILAGRICSGGVTTMEVDLQVDVGQIEKDVKMFIDRLASRVPFIGRQSEPPRTDANFVHKRFLSVDLKVGSPRPKFFELPIDFPSADDAVRADSNAFAMRLNGQLESLAATMAHFQLACMAKEVDIALSATVNDINHVARELAGLKSSYAAIVARPNASKPLHDLISRFEDAVSPCQMRISRSFSPIRELLRAMDAAPGSHDSSIREALYIARRRAVSDAELRLKTLEEDFASFKEAILHAQRLEADRLERIRVEEEQHRQAEEKRLEHEERLRIEEKRRVEEHQHQIERERVAAKEAEKARLERERQEVEKHRWLENEKAMEAQQLQAERARADAEKAKLRQDRIEMQEKLRLMEEQLADERRLQAEKDHVAAQTAERQRIEAEERENLRLGEQRLAEQRRLAAGKERPAAENHEQRRREQESAKSHRHQKKKGPASKHAKGSSSALDDEGNLVFVLSCLAPIDGCTPQMYSVCVLLPLAILRIPKEWQI